MTHRPEEDIATGDSVSMRCSRWDTGVGSGLNLYHGRFLAWHLSWLSSDELETASSWGRAAGWASLGESTQFAAVLAPPLKDLVKTFIRKFDTLIKVCYCAGAVSNCGSRPASG